MWSDEITEIVRYLIDDVDATKYSDSRLSKTVLIGSRYVNEIFQQYYTISLTGSGSISPDPTIERNESFINLAALKTACIVTTGEAKLAAGRGISVSDGGQSVNLGSVSQHVTNAAKNYCEEYEKARTEYLTSGGANGPPGEAIVGPFKYYNVSGRVL